MAGNYRSVSLTSIICKVMESIVRDVLVKYMKDNLLFTDRKFGFLGGRSTTLQLLKVLDDWTEVLDRGGYVDVVYCEFMKAFDTVPHSHLIQVLEYYGVDSFLVKWIRGFLTDRKQCVIINGESSTWSDVSSGIQQGSVLGPVLFVVYINTIVESVTDSELYLFADDAKVYNIMNNEQDLLEPQADLDRMCKWSESSLLRFHQKNVCGWELGGQPRITSKITS